jgi:hypothetical protein
LRRSAQYFVIRSDTALRAAADILDRRRRFEAAVLDLDVPRPVGPRLPRNSSGKAARSAASSRRSSSSRVRAPTTANSRICA